jgi:hypothetical protein
MMGKSNVFFDEKLLIPKNISVRVSLRILGYLN